MLAFYYDKTYFDLDKGITPAKLQLIDRQYAYAVPPIGSSTEIKYIKIKKDEPLVLKHGYFAACLLDNEIKPEKIRFNFVGL